MTMRRSAAEKSRGTMVWNDSGSLCTGRIKMGKPMNETDTMIHNFILNQRKTKENGRNTHMIPTAPCVFSMFNVRFAKKHNLRLDHPRALSPAA